MAWTEDEWALSEALMADIDGWRTVPPAVRSAMLQWILEDRKRGPEQKAEILMANRKASDGEEVETDNGDRGLSEYQSEGS